MKYLGESVQISPIYLEMQPKVWVVLKFEQAPESPGLLIHRLLGLPQEFLICLFCGESWDGLLDGWKNEEISDYVMGQC